MGISIISGVLASLAERSSGSSKSKVAQPARLPSKFIACVRSEASRKRIESEIPNANALTIVQKQNVKSVEESDIVLLACKPFYLSEVLSEPGMKDALKGKLLISILAGVTTEQICEVLYGHKDTTTKEGCTIVRVMPNTNAVIRESMTIIETTPALDDKQSELLTWIFSQIGSVSYLPAANMDAATALCGSGPAFVALMIESMMHGGLACGLPRLELQKMVSQTMIGMALRARDGDKHVAVMKDEVCSAGGCTIYGLDVLEKRALKGSISEAVREATIRASELGTMGAAPRRN
jgi:pyrroline-5-carboxylate reductase